MVGLFAYLLFWEWSQESAAKAELVATTRVDEVSSGLKDGDCWCVCATWYARAIEEDVACSVYLKKTNIKTLELIPIEKLKKFAVDLS